MKHLAIFTPFLAALFLVGCSAAETAVDPAPAPAAGASLTGDWQSLDDTNYVLKLNTDTYREFYENEEMSRDQWQPVKSCDDPQPVEKTATQYGGFQIWTKPTDSRICYAISDWTADGVSLTYAGTTSSYKRID